MQLGSGRYIQVFIFICRKEKDKFLRAAEGFMDATCPWVKTVFLNTRVTCIDTTKRQKHWTKEVGTKAGMRHA